MKIRIIAAVCALTAAVSSVMLAGCDRGAERFTIAAQTAEPGVFRCSGEAGDFFAEYTESGWRKLEAASVTAELSFTLPSGDVRRWSATVPVIGEVGGYRIVSDRAAPAYIALPDDNPTVYAFGGEDSGGVFRYDGQEKVTGAGSLICIPIAFCGVCDVLLYDINTGALSDLSGASYESTDDYIAERLVPASNEIPGWTVPEGENALEYYKQQAMTSSMAYIVYDRYLAYAPVPSQDGRWIFYLASDGEGRYSCDYMAYDTETRQSTVLSADSFGVTSLSSHADELIGCLPSGEVVIVPWMQSAYDAPRPVAVARFDGERWNTETIDREGYEKDGAMLAYGTLVSSGDSGTTVRRISGGGELPLEDVFISYVSVEELIYEGAASGYCFAAWDALPAIMAQSTVLVPDEAGGGYRSVSFGDEVASAMYLCGDTLLVNVGDRVEEVEMSEE